MRTFGKAVLVAAALLGTSSLRAAVAPNPEHAPSLKKEYQDRQQRVKQWYGPARFGVFYHWGMFTGGGDSSTNEPKPFRYETVAEFEAAAADPERIAANLVDAAKRMGAHYITFTLLHSCDRYMVLFPTQTPGFRMKASKDYIGALAARCHQEHMPLLLYLCGGPQHGFSKGGPWLDESLRDVNNFVAAIKGLLDELATLYPGEIAGFWIDGNSSDLPVHMRQKFPGCIIVHNNDGEFGNPNIDYRTTEFLSDPPIPVYSRPSGLTRTLARWNILPPRSDYNEDIPNVGSWWYQGVESNDPRYLNLPYIKTPAFVVKEMVSSLGQRREWNYALGIGPMIDGRLPTGFAPMVDCLQSYFAWAAESIYGTVGGEGSALSSGWWNDGAFGSVTVSRTDPTLLYVHVTTAPSADSLHVPNNGYKVASVSDLRTGSAVLFTDLGVLLIKNRDWSDVEKFGDKVFKINLATDP